MREEGEYPRRKMHLATAMYLQSQGMRVRYATYDTRQLEVARALKFDVLQP